MARRPAEPCGRSSPASEWTGTLLKAFDHRAAELLRYSDAMRHPGIDLRDLWVAHTWIVVARIDHREIPRDLSNNILRKAGYRREWDDMTMRSTPWTAPRASTAAAPISLANVRTPSGLSNPPYGHRLLPRLTSGKGAADIAGSDEADLHWFPRSEYL